MRRRKFLALTSIGTASLAGFPTAAAGNTDTELQSNSKLAGPPSDGDTLADGDGADGAGSVETVGVGERIRGSTLDFVVSSAERVSTIDSRLAMEAVRTRTSQQQFEGVRLPTTARRLFTSVTDDTTIETKDDTEFLRVDVAMKNTATERPLRFDGGVGLGVRTETEFIERAIPVAGLLPRAGQLLPGEVERARLAFVVPAETTTRELQVSFPRAERIGLDKAVVDLETGRESVTTLRQDIATGIRSFGDRVEREGFSIRTNVLKTGTNLDPFLKPSADHEFMMVGARLQNDTGRALEFDRGRILALKDSTGLRRFANANRLRTTRRFDIKRPLQAGKSRTGELAFHVETGLDELYWMADLSRWDLGDKALWHLR